MSVEISIEKLVNFSDGDPCLYIDFPGTYNALLFDTGDVYSLSPTEIGDVAGLFFSHFHFDHFTTFDRVLRLNIDKNKTIAVYGSEGVTHNIQSKLAAYSYHWFPFMKLRLDVHEIADDGTVTRTMFACENKFAPEPAEAPSFKGGLCYENKECRVFFARADHTVPCLNFATELKRGYVFDETKAMAGVLREGPWIAQVLAEMRKAKKDRVKKLTIGGGQFELDALVGDYFSMAPRTRITFCTDTRFNAKSKKGLVTLAEGSVRLYCDAYYLDAEADRAEKYGHMTARQAAEFATEAGVEELILLHLGPKYRGKFDRLLDEARTIFPNTHMILSGEKI